VFLTRLRATLYAAYHLRGQARYPFRPLESILVDRDRRAHRMVAYAYRHVPCYREIMNRLGLSPSEFRCAEDLAKLPLLERSQLQRDPEYFVSTAQPLAKHLRLHTSGSSGAPCAFYHDRRAMHLNRAYAARGRAAFMSLLGRSVGYRHTAMVNLDSAYARTQDFLRQHTLLPPGVRLNRQVLDALDPPETNARLITEFKPDVVVGYGSYLAMVFAHLRATGKPFHRPRAIVYSADSLPESVRQMIEQEYHIPVFGTYGAVEAPVMGFECEHHTGLHLNIDVYPMRLVDAEGNSVPDGESGDVVVSNLVNRASVLLNYRLADVATMSAHPCACGRSLPLLSELQGRSYDSIELPTGELMHGGRMHEPFEGIEGLWQWQVIQESATHLRVGLSVAQTCDRQHLRELITARFAKMFGPLVTLDVQFDSIQRTAGAKVRPVISMCTAEPTRPDSEQGDSCI